MLRGSLTHKGRCTPAGFWLLLALGAVFCLPAIFTLAPAAPLLLFGEHALAEVISVEEIDEETYRAVIRWDGSEAALRVPYRRRTRDLQPGDPLPIKHSRDRTKVTATNVYAPWAGSPIYGGIGALMIGIALTHRPA